MVGSATAGHDRRQADFLAERPANATRTIADLAGEENIAAEHVSEAIHYRRLDRQL